MSEHPILFSGPMVRAILDGRKRQTRRLVRPQPHAAPGDDVDAVVCDDGTAIIGALAKSGFGDKWRCPFGASGDTLWVRESFSPYIYREGYWYWADGREAAYDATRPKPSIFMPRWASRLSLTVESIQVERVQAISDADIRAEGVTPEAVRALWEGATRKHRDAADIRELGRIDLHLPHEWWRLGWIALHGRESWDANPFVWCIGFRRADARAP